MGSRYPGREKDGVEGALMGADSLPVVLLLAPSLSSSVSRKLYLNISFVLRQELGSPLEAVSMATTIASFRVVNQRCHGNPILICPRCWEGEEVRASGAEWER